MIVVNTAKLVVRFTIYCCNDIKIRTKWNKKTLKWVVHQINDDNSKFLNYFNKPKDYWKIYLR